MIEILAEKLDLPQYKAENTWKACMETLYDGLLTGRPIVIDRIGKISIAKSKVKPRNGKTIGGNFIPKMTFYRDFLLEFRNIDIDDND